jgi:hypothetical protein
MEVELRFLLKDISLNNAKKKKKEKKRLLLFPVLGEKGR